jgi:hypothetical protein
MILSNNVKGPRYGTDQSAAALSSFLSTSAIRASARDEMPTHAALQATPLDLEHLYPNLFEKRSRRAQTTKLFRVAAARFATALSIGIAVVGYLRWTL